VEDYEAMVAGPLTGAEGDEQTGRELPDLRLWPQYGIPAQRAEQTTEPGTGAEAAPWPAAPATGPLPAPQAVPRQIAALPGSEPAASEPVASGSAATGPAAELALVPAEPAVPGAGTEAEGDPGADAEGETDGGAAAAARRSDRRSRHRASPMRRQTSTAIAVLAGLAVTFLVLHRFLPDAGGVGSLLETWLPWVGVPVGVLLIAAAVVHTRRALIATLAAALVWTALYGPTLLPRGSSAPQQLRVFSEDVNGDAGEATASGAMALKQQADVVALEDMYASVSQTSAVNALNAAYPYHVTEYEFGLWSKYEISDVTPVAFGTSQPAQSLSLAGDAADLASSSSGGVPAIGALQASLATPHGAVTVYLVHLPQPVLGNQGFAKARDVALTQFVARLKRDRSPRLAVIGDLNVAATDRQFSQLTRGDALTSAQQAAGSGFGFTWPAEFPIVRLDDVLTRGLTPLRSVVLPSIADGQTHLPIQVDLDY
jgi:vancomycin resistance protein VanJ